MKHTIIPNSNATPCKAPIIAVTGGPSAYKSIGLRIIQKELLEQGFLPILVAETPSSLLGAGIHYKHLAGNLAAQKAYMGFQLTIENMMIDLANALVENGQKAVIFLDRTTIDQKAYTTTEEWDELMTYFKTNEPRLFSRYPHVIHLETAPREFYTTENNLLRDEGHEKAKALSEQVKNAYCGAEHLIIIPNAPDGDLDKKMAHFRRVVANLVSDTPIEDELKFKVESFFDPANIPVTTSHSVVTQDYLLGEDPNIVARVRKRVYEGYLGYLSHTVKNRTTKEEVDQPIDDYYYDILLRSADPAKKTVTKDRYCFIWKDRYFELDVFTSVPGLILLELELSPGDDKSAVELPEWLGPLTDVTDDKRYKNENIATM